MKRSFYTEQDSAFGQLMVTLRTTIGLTQAGLGDLLGVSRRAVGKWASQHDTEQNMSLMRHELHVDTEQRQYFAPS